MIDAITYALLKGDIGQGTQEAVSDYLDEHLTNPTNPPIDTSLTISGAAADAKETGDKITQLKEDLYPVKSTLISAFNKNRYDGYSEEGYLTSTGVLAISQDWRTTSLVYVGDLATVFCSGERISSGNRESINFFFLCTYDASGNLIEQVSSPTDTYTVGSSVDYIRFSYHSNTFHKIQVESGTRRTDYVAYDYNAFPTAVKSVENALASKSIDYGNTVSILDELTISNGYIDVNSGVFYEYANAESTDFMNIYEYDDLFVTGAPLYSSNCLYAIYDSNKVFLGSYKNNTVETNYHFTARNVFATYPTAEYVRFSSITASGGSHLFINKPVGTLWVGKKWVCVGDSLTEANGRTTKHYYDYVRDVTGINITVLGVSGTGYANGGSSGTDSFRERISNVPTDADVVTIFGSFNDLNAGLDLGTATDTGTSTIGGCINSTLDNLFSVLPLANVGVVAPTPWIYSNPTNEPNTASQYCDLLKAICERRSIPYLDLFHCSLLRPWDSTFRTLAYSKDDGNGVHPDETGHKLIAPRFKGFLETLLL